jgi:hypothetical protein
MRTTRRNEPTVLIARALVWVAGRAIECAPVIGPIFKVVNFVNDVAELRKAYAEPEAEITF